MVYVMTVFLFGFVLGLAAVASNPSPYFGAFGLVLAAGMGCGVLVEHGATFLSLVLFLIYLGGMLVVFAYSAALAAEPYPESWASWPVMGLMMFYLLATFGCSYYFWAEWGTTAWGLGDDYGDVSLGYGDTEGVTVMYSDGYIYLFAGGGALFLTLFVVLELTRGFNRGALRVV